MFYDATYLVDRYILVDAFRPQPGWGKKVTRVVMLKSVPRNYEQAEQRRLERAKAIAG